LAPRPGARRAGCTRAAAPAMAEIVASILATDPTQVARDARRAAMAGADWVELRLDRWPTGVDLIPVVQGISLPVLVACRTVEDGGHWDGTHADRRGLLNSALKGGALGLDLEDWETWAPPAGQNRLRLLVRSYHRLAGAPDDLVGLHERLSAMRGNVVKIAATAHDLADAAGMLDLMGGIDQDEHPTTAFCMGRTAWPTRVLGALMGAPLVYGSVEDGAATAPGQLPVAVLHQRYRVKELGGDTELFGLLGQPALHSLGPVLYNRLFRELGRNAVYLPFETSRPAAVLAMLPSRQLRGLSVTAPYKEDGARLVHRMAEDAAAVDAVNTIVFEAHGMATGYNTDVAGVASALVGAGFAPAGGGAVGVVLGAGGGARAAATALHQLGLDVVVLARRLDGIRDFTKRHGFKLGSLKTAVLDELEPAVVVHATPVGSAGLDPEERLVGDWVPRPGTFVLDMVYVPEQTRLLREVAAAGAVAVSGLQMFLGQAAAQTERFVGVRPGAADLRRYLDF